ncbi:MAG TPA: hypothetical protein VK716_14040 [Terracidiphilus sp.]|jgi:hypothetical protein|nr:hypothetical protein [Terracidiphilus sp.]
MPELLHVPSNHPLNGIRDDLKEKFRASQESLLELEFSSGYDLCARAVSDLKVNLSVPEELRDTPATSFGDRKHKALMKLFIDALLKDGMPEHAVGKQAETLAQRVELLRAFKHPDAVVEFAEEKVTDIVRRFPVSAKQIQCGRNPGDVLDPYIFAAAQGLIYIDDFEGTITATVSHKVLMMIEGLIGHLHEDVIGFMRGNVRVPEPRGKDQESFDPQMNPFPGADLVQPPLSNRPVRFHQLKSKTGSAKGGDGARLGIQLKKLREYYGGEVFYDALIGNTLRGHRSMAGVLKQEPNVVVLVGDAAFRELTGSSVGPELLLRLYQSTFEVVARKSGYKLEEVVKSVFASFQERLEKEDSGAGFIELVLHDAVNGPANEQDSRLSRPEGVQAMASESPAASTDEVLPNDSEP